MDIVEVLKLQELELKRLKLEMDLKHIEDERLKLESDMKKMLRDLELTRKKLDSKQRKIKDILDFIAYKEKLIDELEKRKAHSASRKEFKDAVRLISKYEDEIIKSRNEVSNLEVDLNIIEEGYRKLKSDVKPKQAELKSKIDENRRKASNLKKQISRLDEEIEKQKQKVPKDLLGLYESLKDKFNGLVFADISSGSCEGCGMTYSINELRNLTKNLEIGRTKCPYCGRFIYNREKLPPY